MRPPTGLDVRQVPIEYDDPRPGEISSIEGRMIVDWSTIQFVGGTVSFSFKLLSEGTRINYE